MARRDFAWNILYELLFLPVAFHPAAMWMRREIARTREMACDELVAGRLLEPAVYVQSILSIAARMSGAGKLGYALGVFDGDMLEERVRRLLEGRRGSLKRARLALAAGLSAPESWTTAQTRR